MDDEHTAGYREPCAQCSAVAWGISEEGRFYCMSCHNVIERTKEVVDLTFMRGTTRVSTLGKGQRTKKPERGHRWTICEGFQMILKNQADALLRLGVAPHFKEDVLRPLWRRYLQTSRQAYTSDPVRRVTFRACGRNSDSDSAAESSAVSCSGTDRESNPPSNAGSGEESFNDWSGSEDAITYLMPRQRRSRGLMTMKKTLALIHLALMWSREALTLSDLLRLVKEGHVPYVNAYEQLPKEMKVIGKDARLFNVKSVPSHQLVHKEAQSLGLFLQLPAFPPISRQTLLHPALLSLRYLMDANLPDELHLWVCRLMERAGMADQTLHTFDPSSRRALPRYDVQAAALIIVTMKVIFGLDDHTEWDLSNEAGLQDNSGDMFNLRRWYRLLQAALIRGEQRRDRDIARKKWSADKPIFPSRKSKWWIIKKKRIGEQVQKCFEKLSSCPVGVQEVSPSGFRFCWGDEDGSDGPSLHHMKLDAVVTSKQNFRTPSNASYWHPPLRPCDRRSCSSSHYSEMEATLPRTFVWLLQLFSFLLDVKPSYMYEEVLMVERLVLMNGTGTRTRTGTRASSRTPQTSQETEGES
ncbi:TATA box-binding protein-associated factor RNA polymerase I subunit B [Embiotoca jacksoni]|uniref:TATA box-binding protein-associated factor RNA polymerase I subunit B n=1 Tax=Embiotoca jacksoni TaxID=100190 RepID=UPI0037045EEC